MRPRGNPPASARSRASKPVGTKAGKRLSDRASFTRMARSRSRSVMRLTLPASGNWSRCRGVRHGNGLGHGIRLGQPQRLAQLGIDGLADIGIVLEELPRVLPALPDPIAFVAVPRPALLDDVLRRAQIE